MCMVVDPGSEHQNSQMKSLSGFIVVRIKYISDIIHHRRCVRKSIPAKKTQIP